MQEDILRQIREYPHLLGIAAGKLLLSDIHSEMIRYIWDTQESRGIQAHRGSYKTTANTIIAPIWWMLFHPNDRIGIIRKTATDAFETVATIRNLMRLEELQAIFKMAHGLAPKAITNRKDKVTYNFKSTITPEGNLNAYGVDGAITGSHLDRIIVDDVITRRDRWSKAERERTKDYIREIQTNILDPGQPLSAAGTPWHPDDAWTVLPEPKKYTIEECQILSPEEIEAKRKLTTPALFAINYLLEHRASEDCLFSTPCMNKWDWTSKSEVVAHVDASFQGTHTSALTIAQDTAEGKIQMTGFTDTGHIKEWIPQIYSLLKRYRVKKIWVETNPDKGYTAELLRNYIEEHTDAFQQKTEVIEYHEDLKKDVKIATYLYKYWDDVIWDEYTEAEYLSQVTEWMEGQEPDDAPDSAASLLRMWRDGEGSLPDGYWGW